MPSAPSLLTFAIEHAGAVCYNESMGKPVKEITIATLEEKTSTVLALFDCGSFFSIIREDKVPKGATVVWRATPKEFKTATEGGKLIVTGELPLVMTIGEKMIEDSVLVSPHLAQDMLVGAGTMQKWDISIVNINGQTDVVVKHDLRDPQINEVD